MKRTQNTEHSAGFTLIEVLIAIAILSILITALYSTFFLSQKAIGVVDNSLLRLQESRGTLDTLKREIESVFYSPDRQYSIFKVDDRDFYGRQASEISFTTFSPLMPGLSIISYTLEEDGGKLTLRKKITSAYFPSEDAKSVELIEDIESFTVEIRRNGGWVRTWDSGLTNTFPSEVRITVTVIYGDSQKQISLSDIARLRIGRKI